MSDKPKDEKESPKNPRDQKSTPQKDTPAAKSAAKSLPNPSESPNQSKPFSKSQSSKGLLLLLEIYNCFFLYKVPGLASEFLKNKEKLEQLTKKGAFKIQEQQTSPKPIQDLENITKNSQYELIFIPDQFFTIFAVFQGLEIWRNSSIKSKKAHQKKRRKRADREQIR